MYGKLSGELVLFLIVDLFENQPKRKFHMLLNSSKEGKAVEQIYLTETFVIK